MATGISTDGSTGTTVLAGAIVEEGGVLVLVAGVVEAVVVSLGLVVVVAAACEPAELEQAASNSGVASHSDRALAPIMIVDSTVSAPDALVVETGPSPVVALQKVAGIDDGPTGHPRRHLSDVEPTEVVPFGQHGQYVGAIAR